MDQTAEQNRKNGRKTEEEVFNLLKESDFKILIDESNKEIFDIQFNQYALEVKSCELIHKIKEKIRFGRFTLRKQNHFQFGEYCAKNNLIPIYVFLIKIKNKTIYKFFSTWDAVDKFIQKNDAKKSTISFLQILQDSKQIEELIKNGKRKIPR